MDREVLQTLTSGLEGAPAASGQVGHIARTQGLFTVIRGQDAPAGYDMDEHIDLRTEVGIDPVPRGKTDQVGVELTVRLVDRPGRSAAGLGGQLGDVHQHSRR